MTRLYSQVSQILLVVIYKKLVLSVVKNEVGDN